MKLTIYSMRKYSMWTPIQYEIAIGEKERLELIKAGFQWKVCREIEIKNDKVVE